MVSPVTDYEQIFIGSLDGFMYALEKNTGKVNWKRNLDFPVRSTAAIEGNVLHLGVYGFLYALDTLTGRQIWKSNINGAIYAKALLSKNKIYLGSYERNIAAFEQLGGSLIWHLNSVGSIKSSLVAYNDWVFVGCQLGWLYAIDAKTGRFQWKYALGEPIIYTPFLIGGRLIICGHKLYIFTCN